MNVVIEDRAVDLALRQSGTGERVCPAAQTNSPRHAQDLLRALSQALPKDAYPILVTDAGFLAPWFKAVEKHGWDWVGRVRHRLLVKPIDVPDERAQWVACRMLYALATVLPRELGMFDIVRNHPVQCRLIVHRKPARGRVDRTRTGHWARRHCSREIARRESEPWLLAASSGLCDLTAAQIVALYARRVQIEQSLRDLKSHRYGVGFEDSLTRVRARLAILLLLHALACFAIWIAAKTAPRRAIDRVVAATVRVTQRTALSWHRIGWMLLRSGHWRYNLVAAQRIIRSAGDALLAA